MNTAQQRKAVSNSIAEAQAALKANQEEIARVNATAEPHGKAIEHCRRTIAARAEAQRRVDDLMNARRALVADEVPTPADDATLPSPRVARKKGRRNASLGAAPASLWQNPARQLYSITSLGSDLCTCSCC